jgi:hypothetical protein
MSPSIEGHHDGVADSDLTVTDQAILGRHLPELLTPERQGYEVEEGTRSTEDECSGRHE